MSDNTMTINLRAPVFNVQEEKQLEFVVNFQALLATKGFDEAIQTYFKSKLPAMEDEKLDAIIELGKAKISAKMKNAMSMAYMTQCLHLMAMLNAIFNI